MFKFIVVKTDVETDLNIEIVYKTEHENVADAIVEILEKDRTDESYFYCVDEIWE